MLIPSYLMKHRRIAVVGVHLGLWSLAYLGAFLLRFDFQIPEQYQQVQYIGWLLPLLIFRTATFAWFGMFHGMWRYTGVRDLEGILKATVAATAVLALCIQFAGVRPFPRSIFIVEPLLAITFIGGLRVAIRALIQLNPRPDTNTVRGRVLIVGAGDSGEMLLREMLKTLTDRYEAVGFLDDDPAKVGAHIHGVPVLAPIDQAPDIIAAKEVDEVVIAIPSATGKEMRRIVEACQAPGVGIRTLPNFDDLIGGRVTYNQIREVAIEDLLGRDPVRLDSRAIADVVQGEVVMVTGAGGSIGAELCRQVGRFGPRQLILIDQAENALYHIHRELRPRFADVDLVPIIADICDATRVDTLMARYRPTLVLHAAAHKHVPMMEANPGEAIKNNIGGTRIVANAAHAAGVRRFVMISTDKAVNPTSVMGCTKRVAELYVQSMAQRSQTTFVTVRFGNVLGSNGSVIPLFKEQIARGGPVTVTHSEMVRYFMTIPEASQLVLQAGSIGRSGEIYILDMGEPVRILTLAEDLITLSGFKPYEDIEISITGIRPGEKLFEELSVNEENATTTEHPKIFVGRSVARPYPVVDGAVEGLLEAADHDDGHGIRARLRDVVPEYRHEKGELIPMERPKQVEAR